MAQVSDGEQQRVGRFALRSIAMIVGLSGAILALALNVLYSIFQALAQAAGLPMDNTNFLYGLLLTLLGAAGALLAPTIHIVAAVLLAVAGIGLFFIIGWWAIIVSPFFLSASLLTVSNRRVDIPGME